MIGRAIALSIVPLMLVGCGTPPATSPSPAAPHRAANASAPSEGHGSTAETGEEPTFEGTTGTLEKKRSAAGSVILESVRAARHDRFDRVVFQFRGDTLPGYHAEYIDAPVRRCGSGAEVEIAGDGWLEVRFPSAQAHTDGGAATVKERDEKPGLPNLKQLVQTCDFEGDVTWVLGLASPNAYRVVELRNPPRVAVDVKH